MIPGTTTRKHTHTHKHTHTYTHTHTHKHTHTLLHTRADLQLTKPHTHIHTHTHTYAHIHTHKHTHEHTRTHIHIHTHACTRTHTHKHTHVHAHTHTYSCTLVHTHHKFILADTHTHTHTHMCYSPPLVHTAGMGDEDEAALLSKLSLHSPREDDYAAALEQLASFNLTNVGIHEHAQNATSNRLNISRALLQQAFATRLCKQGRVQEAQELFKQLQSLRASHLTKEAKGAAHWHTRTRMNAHTHANTHIHTHTHIQRERCVRTQGCLPHTDT